MKRRVDRVDWIDVALIAGALIALIAAALLTLIGFVMGVG